MDENRPNDIDGIFKDSLQSHLDEPSKAVWDKIENQLDREDILFYKSRLRLLRRISACLLVIIFALGSRVLFHYRYGEPVKTIGIHKGGEGVTVSARKTGNKPRKDRTDAVSPTLSGAGLLSKDGFIKPGLEAISTDENPSFYKKYTVGAEDFLSGQSVQSQAVAYHRDGFLSVSPAIHLEQPKPEISSFDIAKIAVQAFLTRFSVTAYFSKEFAGYNLSDNNDSTGANGKEIEKKERNVFSASVGIFVSYKLKKRWIIESGLSYSWSSSILDPSESFAVKDNNGHIQFKVNTITGYGYLPSSSTAVPNVGDSVLTDKVYNNLHYLTVPLMAAYVINLKRFTLLAGGGVTFNFLTDATVETKIKGPSYDQHESVVTMYGLKKINYGILLKAELQYNVNAKWGVSLMPYFKNALSPINIRSALSTYPYNFGIALGISHRF
jgi:hypothetical protein